MVSEVHGTWGRGTAIEVPGTAALTRVGTPRFGDSKSDSNTGFHQANPAHPGDQRYQLDMP